MSMSDIELSRDFVNKRITVLEHVPEKWTMDQGRYYQLDLRMCFLQHVKYGFPWGNSTKLSGIVPITEQPGRILKLDLSLNDLKYIDEAATDPLRQVRYLNGSVNRIQSIRGVGVLQHLVILDLSYNYITSLKDLAPCTKLVELKVNYNMINSIFDMPLLTNLVKLNIDGNKLKSLEGITSVPDLEEFTARRNIIDSIIPLSTCKKIKVLDLAGNKLRDLDKTMKILHNMQNLVDISMKDNPLSETGNYQSALKAIMTLQAIDGLNMVKQNGRLFDEDELYAGSSEISHFRKVTRLAYLERIRHSRIQTEENVRTLQTRIIAMMEDQYKLEETMMEEMRRTLGHIDHMDKFPILNFSGDYVPQQPFMPPLPGERVEYADAVAVVDQQKGWQQSKFQAPDDVLRMAAMKLTRENPQGAQKPKGHYHNPNGRITEESDFS